MNKYLKQLVLAVLCLIVGAGTALAAGNIVIKGSTTVLPVAQVTLEAYMKANPGVNISLSGGGSGEGIKALIDKSTDIANSSREIKKEETALANSKGVGDWQGTSIRRRSAQPRPRHPPTTARVRSRLPSSAARPPVACALLDKADNPKV